jgi:hypothetical protein
MKMLAVPWERSAFRPSRLGGICRRDAGAPGTPIFEAEKEYGFYSSYELADDFHPHNPIATDKMIEIEIFSCAWGFEMSGIGSPRPTVPLGPVGRGVSRRKSING